MCSLWQVVQNYHFAKPHENPNESVSFNLTPLANTVVPIQVWNSMNGRPPPTLVAVPCSSTKVVPWWSDPHPSPSHAGLMSPLSASSGQFMTLPPAELHKIKSGWTHSFFIPKWLGECVIFKVNFLSLCVFLKMFFFLGKFICLSPSHLPE